MKNIFKKAIVTGAVVITLGVGGVVGSTIFTPTKVSGTDEITVEEYNATIDELEAKIQELSDKIVLLVESDTTINTKINANESEMLIVKTSINTVKSDLTSTKNTVSKIDGWYTKWRELNTYKNGNGGYYNDTYITAQIRLYWESQQ